MSSSRGQSRAHWIGFNMWYGIGIFAVTVVTCLIFTWTITLGKADR